MRERFIGPLNTNFERQVSYDRITPATDWAAISGWESEFNALQRVEMMKDEKHPPLPCGFKPCLHYKLDGHWIADRRFFESHPIGAETYYVDRAASILLSEFASGVVPYLESLYGGAHVNLTHSDRWHMSSVWEKAKPRLEPDMDILVFLAEISEVPELLRSVWKKFNYLLDESVGTFGEKVIKYVDGLRVLKSHKDVGLKGMVKVVMDESSHALSGEWLEYNFALQPTVNDLIGAISALFTWEKKMQDLIKGANKKQKSSFSFSTNESADPEIILAPTDCRTFCSGKYGNVCPYEGTFFQNPVTNNAVPGFYCYATTPGGVDTRIGLTVFYRYTLPDWVTDVSARINGLAASLGCNPGLGTIWELIPFSFVVDWVLPIGDILNRARIDAIPVKTEILDVCWTKKITRPVVVTMATGPHPSSREVVTIYSGRLESYQRIVGTEPFTWIPAFSWPNWFQLSLGAALADLFRK